MASVRFFQLSGRVPCVEQTYFTACKACKPPTMPLPSHEHFSISAAVRRACMGHDLESTCELAGGKMDCGEAGHF